MANPHAARIPAIFVRQIIFFDAIRAGSGKISAEVWQEDMPEGTS